MAKKALSRNENKERIVTSDLCCLQPPGRGRGVIFRRSREAPGASTNDLTGMDTEVDDTQAEFSGAKNTLHVLLAC